MQKPALIGENLLVERLLCLKAVTPQSLRV
jgi:hypothetical protein